MKKDLEYFQFFVISDGKKINLKMVYKNENISKIKIIIEYQITSL